MIYVHTYITQRFIIDVHTYVTQRFIIDVHTYITHHFIVFYEQDNQRTLTE